MDKKSFYVPPPEKTHELSEEEARPERKSILLLDDEVTLTELLRGYLEENQFQVTCVKNGVEGVKQIMANDFDAVVCDMMMPHMPGDMFYLAVERTKPHLCKRFIFMTGHKGDKKIDEFIRKVRGMILWKPFEPHQLLETIQAVLSRKS